MDFSTYSEPILQTVIKEERIKKVDEKSQVEQFVVANNKASNLTMLVDLIRSSGLSGSEMNELMNQLEKNRNDDKPLLVTAPPRHFTLPGQKLQILRSALILYHLIHRF